MGRWRPPGEASTAVITRAGHDRLKAELDELWRVQRPEVVRALSAAAAEGDRSENAEYTYRKKQLAGIDRRVRYLSRRLQALKVVEGRPADPGKVFFGATVDLDPVDGGAPVRYRIVGPDETDAAAAGSASTRRWRARCWAGASTTRSRCGCPRAKPVSWSRESNTA
jgi:transcription elongation factor GreB